MDNEIIVRNLLKDFLTVPKAHHTFNQAVENFPIEFINKKVDGIEYSAWQLIEHIRIALADIYDFMINQDYKEMNWPYDYWPNIDEEADEDKWNQSIQQINDCTDNLIKMLENEEVNIYSDLPHAKGYNILREIILVIDHNAYHIGQFVILRKLLGIWN